MLAGAEHPIDRRLKIGDLSFSACRPPDQRMSIRNQVRVRFELERAIMPENQWKISSGQGVPRADLPQVRVVDEETDQAQEEWHYQSLQVRGDPFSGR